MCMADRQARGKMRSTLGRSCWRRGICSVDAEHSRFDWIWPEIRGDESRGLGGADYKDVMAGVHDLLNRGIADGNVWELRLVVRRIHEASGHYADE